ncbi:NADP-dependent oxidoreductase [Jatrophihabitans telluris]|uniref:NADP-dependent oxidoreductase n=1 Tax=Jatrophihabitans telluris TaxID=2038343 RepID=A0ABY4QX56_9ACTN|nr:NADP-dependent oxidoreductase [Jatrophihabitans telluris]UQX87406.1 NADP-dependent oxidoreductase [Jatrophihabitans telluris]
MKAFALSDFDAPPSVVDLPRPVPAAGQVLVRVHATSVNPVDLLISSGFFRTVQEYRFPAVFGRDLAGVVEQVGAGVTRFAVGDAVYGFVKRDYIGDGTFAEYVVVPEDMFIGPAPLGLELASAGVLAQGGITALECVDAVVSGPGDVVLVNGATGGVGVYAIQIAAACGAEVIATARTYEQQTLARSLGAKHVIDWSAGDLVEQVRALVPAGVHGFIDLVKHVDSARIGENEAEAHALVARLCRGLLREGGRAASVTNGGVPELLGDIPCANVHSSPTPESIARLTALVEAGQVVAPVYATYRFAELAAAFDLLAAGPALGKISVILEPGSQA